MEDLSVTAQRRTVFGKHVRALRRQGLIPANVFGRGRDSEALQMPRKELETLLARLEGAAIVKLTLDSQESRPVLVKHVQRDPVTDNVLHVDFLRVEMTEKLRVEIPLHFIGESPAVKLLDGTLLHSVSTVEVEALPGDLPSHIEVDISSLTDFNAAIHVRDIQVPPLMEILDDPDELVAKVQAPSVAAEEVAAAAEEAVAAEEGSEAKTEAGA